MATAEELDREIQIAHEIQTSTLPDFMPDAADYDFAGRFWPTDQTGGDTYDVVAIDNEHVFLLLADATGHGIGPAVSALQVQSMFRVALRLGADIDACFRHVNDQMVEDLPPGRFVTAFFGLLHTDRHELRFHSAGQGPILLYHGRDDSHQWLHPTCFPMGFMEHDEEQQAHSLCLEPGDILALITDGIYEYENHVAEQFGMERVLQTIRDNASLPMQQLVDVVKEAAESFANGAPQLDDITVVLIRREQVD